MTRRLLLLLFTVLALALSAAACGGDDDDEAADEPAAEETTTHEENGEGTHLTLTATDTQFDQTELTAPAGEVTIELVNDSDLPHNVEVEGNGIEEVSDTISSGSTELALTLDPGEYTFYCAVPGHREAGMEGTLTVE